MYMDIQISTIAGLLHSNQRSTKGFRSSGPPNLQDLFTETLFNVHRFHLLKELKNRQHTSYYLL